MTGWKPVSLLEAIAASECGFSPNSEAVLILAGRAVAKSRLARFTPPVQFEFLTRLMRGRTPERGPLLVGGHPVRLALVRNPRARRYILRLQADGSARVTVPRGGSEREARLFAERQAGWIERQLLRQATHPVRRRSWDSGTEILLRGERVRLEAVADGAHAFIRFGTETIRVATAAGDLRPAVERHLWRLAARELPPRVLELAAAHAQTVSRVTIRNQRSRWGSCSRRAAISLNWRLLQMPSAVRDYIILHELAHLREMNHSVRFWDAVARVCPDYAAAERWLKEHASLLR